MVFRISPLALSRRFIRVRETLARFERSLWAALVLLVAVPSGSLLAQTPVPARQNDWLVGATFGVAGQVSSRFDPVPFTVGITATRVEPGRLGGDFSLGTMPNLLIHGVLPIGARAGLTLPVALSDHVLLLPSAGASLISTMGDDVNFAEPGFNVGAAAMLLNDNSAGVRAGITLNRFRGIGGTVVLFELGIVRPHWGR